MKFLTPERALIFRITHAENVAGILDAGQITCPSAAGSGTAFVNIGSLDLIGKRARRQVPVPPGGTLSDYVPFYFTPHSIMMYNIRTGHGGITRQHNRDIVIFVSSLHRVQELGRPFVFTNQHAYAAGTDFFADLAHLDQVDWPLLRERDFKTDDADPGKQLRYQAEALVHQFVPLDAIVGLCCYDDTVREYLEAQIAARGAAIPVAVRPAYYF